MENSIFNQEVLNSTLQRIQALNLDTKSKWGQMSVGQVVCHMSDPIRDLMNIRKPKIVVPFFLQGLMRKMVIVSKDWKPNTPTLKPYDQIKGDGTRPTEFSKDKANLLELVNSFSNLKQDYVYGKHPGLGNLSRDQAGYFVWKHLDHHLRQFGV